jgi:type II restriction enzyme
MRQNSNLALKTEWLADVACCIEKLKKELFTLNDVYAFEEELSLKHPDNKHVRDKIRQQLQILRDRGMIEFLGSGNYRLLKEKA